jgi:SAM-dependent methyltransferase
MTVDPRPIEAVKDGGWRQIAAVNAALDRGEIDEAGWHAAMMDLVVPAYLAADTPWGQSGKSGTAADWEAGRRLVMDAVDADGSFLDIGCASGYLMQSVQRWGRDRGLAVEPYGLDIAPELAELARSRLPEWADRIWVGNALHWRAPGGRRFDVVRTGLEYVPQRRHLDLVEHLLESVVGRRLIIGVFTEEIAERFTERALTEAGFSVAGRSETAHSDDRVMRRLLWIDR